MIVVVSRVGLQVHITQDSYPIMMDLHRNLQVNIRRQSVCRIGDGIDKDVAGDWDPISEAKEAVIISDNADFSLLGETVACGFDRILDTRERILASERKVQAPIVPLLINFSVVVVWEEADDLIVECGEGTTFDVLHANYTGRLTEDLGKQKTRGGGNAIVKILVII
jgi:hypothetical protein